MTETPTGHRRTFARRYPYLLIFYLIVGVTGRPVAAFAEQGATAPASRALAETVAEQQRRIARLEARLERLSAELAELRDERAAAAPASAPEQPPGGVVGWEPAPVFASSDGAFSFKPRARIDLDVVALTERDDRLSHEAGASFRRLRLGFEGRAYQDFRYKTEADFADGETVSLRDVYVEYTGWDFAALKAGHFKAPYTLADMTSGTVLAFFERPLMVNAFKAGAGRKIGVMLSSGGEAWTGAFGFFGDDPTDARALDADGWSVHGRVTAAPWASGDRALHLGTSAYYREESERLVRFRDRPELRLGGRRLVSTGRIPTDAYRFLGLELAGVAGPLGVMAEWGRVEVERPGAGDVDFSGGYVSLSRFLTGEQQNYRADRGVFRAIDSDRLLSDGGAGAWELALRYSYLDLEDEDVLGGRQDNWTLALNWYVLPRMRLQLNYVLFDVRDSAAEPPAGVADGSFVDFEGATYGVRLQSSW